jgi:putative DNA primase/helicase
MQHHSPLFFNTNALSFDYDPEAPAPKYWSRFLNEIWNDDEQAQDTLQELTGLLLTADTSHQKNFMLVGPPRSGKGTIGRVLTALLGRDNVAFPSLASLNTNFGLSPLIGKRLAIVSDARMGTSKDGSTIAERLLSISGEDGQQIDRKYQTHWLGRMSVRFLLMTNELPRISDVSTALASRFVLLVMKKSFLGKEDAGLTDKLMKELPGVLNWALDGLDRLRKRGHFVMPNSSKDAIRLFEDLASPTGAFLRDWCEKGPTKREPVKRLYDAWCKWAEVHGHKPGSSALFGRGLAAAEARIITRGRGTDRFYEGVQLTMYGEAEYRRAMRDLG